jgi:hypothetical protein
MATLPLDVQPLAISEVFPRRTGNLMVQERQDGPRIAYTNVRALWRLRSLNFAPRAGSLTLRDILQAGLRCRCGLVQDPARPLVHIPIDSLIAIVTWRTNIAPCARASAIPIAATSTKYSIS